MENRPIKEYTEKLQEIYERYGSHDHLQQYQLLDMQKELAALEGIARTLREDVEAVIEQKETHCGRCGEEFYELNEESNESGGWCSYCGGVGQ